MDVGAVGRDILLAQACGGCKRQGIDDWLLQMSPRVDQQSSLICEVQSFYCDRVDT